MSGLTWHAWGRLLVLRRQLNSMFVTNSNSHFIVYPFAHVPEALRRHALRRPTLWRRAKFSSDGAVVSLSNQLLINTTSGYVIHDTASRPSQVSQLRQTPAGLDAGGMTTMPDTPDTWHHTRWQSSHLSSCTRLISRRLGAASVELWSATHWRSGLHCSHKLIDDLVR